jgi:hypothetical protein
MSTEEEVRPGEVTVTVMVPVASPLPITPNAKPW